MLLLYKPIYVGVLYIIVYIGAVAVLFLFVLMLVNLREEAIDNLSSSRKEFNVNSVQYFLGLVLTSYVFLLSVKSSNFVYADLMDLKAWSDLSTKTIVYSLFKPTIDSLDFSSYANYVNLWSETFMLKPNQIMLILMNLMTFDSMLETQLGSEFLHNLARLSNELGTSGLRDVVVYIMSDLQNTLATDLLYQFKGLEESTKLVSPLFTDKYSNILYGAGSLLLLALIGSVYITKEAV